MIRRTSSNNRQEEATLNLTPLLDVIFVILVMFMLIAPLLRLEQVELANGYTNTTMPQHGVQNSLIQIHVYSDNSIQVNKQKVSKEQLKSTLKSLYALYPQAKPLVFYDHRATFGTYQDLKAELEAVGFNEMQLVLKPT
jgi:biopolymer transport protein ExbD